MHDGNATLFGDCLSSLVMLGYLYFILILHILHIFLWVVVNQLRRDLSQMALSDCMVWHLDLATTDTQLLPRHLLLIVMLPICLLRTCSRFRRRKHFLEILLLVFEVKYLTEVLANIFHFLGLHKIECFTSLNVSLILEMSNDLFLNSVPNPQVPLMIAQLAFIIHLPQLHAKGKVLLWSRRGNGFNVKSAVGDLVWVQSGPLLEEISGRQEFVYYLPRHSDFLK